MGYISSRRAFLKQSGWAVAALTGCGSFPRSRAVAGTQPNIVFLVADNLGSEALDFYKNSASPIAKKLDIKTPRLDRLAAEGVTFDNCLIGTPLCSPARCGWNTGRHGYRVGINKQTTPNDPNSGLSDKEITIAELLKSVGYDTGLFGKWNLGYAKKFNPLYRGFDEFYGSLSGHADYYTHIYNKDNKRYFYHGLTPINDKGYYDKLFTDKALGYLRRHRDSSRPFYLNLPFYATHGPYQPPPGYKDGDDDTNFKSMVEYLDTCVGRVVDEIEREGMTDRTLLVFLSDQGASHLNNYGRNLSENALKVACVARWPGKIPAGTRIETPWLHLDLFAVFAALAGADMPTDRVMDAVNVWPMFEGHEMKHDRTFYWTYKNQDAIRIGDWKLILNKGDVEALYNLADDPDETTDLSAKYPQKISRMIPMIKTWKKECEAGQTSSA